MSPSRDPSGEAGDTALVLGDCDQRRHRAVGIVAVAGSEGSEVPPITPVPVAVAVSVTKPASTCGGHRVGVVGVQMTELSGPAAATVRDR